MFTPRHLIGKTVLDVPGETQPSPESRFNGIRDLVRLAAGRRQAKAKAVEDEDASVAASGGKISQLRNKYTVTSQKESHIDELVFNHDIDQTGHVEEAQAEQEAALRKRLKRPVIAADGRPFDAQRPSVVSENRPRIIHLDNLPLPQKHPQAGFKRQFAWSHKPTAWNNPVTWEDPPEPGKRPSHPVSSSGAVATDRKRVFPEKAVPTGIPPPHMSKAPNGNAWGGWARCGAPGRAAMDGLWEVEPHDSHLEGAEEAEFRVSDARIKMQPGMKSQDTSWLTRWHWDARNDIDPPKQNKYRDGSPIAFCTNTREENVFRPPAGKPGLLQT